MHILNLNTRQEEKQNKKPHKKWRKEQCIHWALLLSLLAWTLYIKVQIIIAWLNGKFKHKILLFCLLFKQK